ncbi:plastocyanin/azurin family copper-binding protein [Halobacteriales archaeon Cl-PHB]
MERRHFLQSAGVVGAGLAAGCLGGSANTAAGEYDVGMSVVAFKPDVITVTAGETVVWKNTSKQGHTVTAYEDRIPDEADYFASGGFASQAAAEEAWRNAAGGRLDTNGDTYEHTFEVPGTYSYYCIPHESRGMVGTVEVEPAD